MESWARSWVFFNKVGWLHRRIQHLGKLGREKARIPEILCWALTMRWVILILFLSNSFY
jgi:hypothetical protein